MKSLQTNLLPLNGEAYLIPKYIHDDQFALSLLKEELLWRKDKIQMFGNTYEQKRLVAWHGDLGVRYTYSKIEMESPGWTPTLLKIKEKIRTEFSVNFNSCLVNLYRDGSDHMSYHSDNESELGKNPHIFSVSLGGPRDFYLKHNDNRAIVKLKLGGGDLLIMRGETQHCWKHSIPKRKNVDFERMNLTFRIIY